MRARVRGNRNREREQPFAGLGFSGRDASPTTGSERSRSGAHCHGNTEVSQGLNFVAGAAFWQSRVQISWQAQHFRKDKYRLRGRLSIFLLLARTHRKSHLARTRKAAHAEDFVAGAAFSQGQVQIPWQAQQFRKVRYRFRGRRNTFVIEGTSTFFQLQHENRKS